jgi:divalent metal cation (Fe/Co/Zn/Cd) transporter
LVLATNVDTIRLVVEARLPLTHHEHATLVWRVKLISWLSLAYMGVEAVVGIYAGLAASSIALIGWGIDSTIEAVASLVIIWRFTGERIHSEDAERTAQKVVAVSFFLLAPYVAIQATRQLVTGSEPKASWVGIALALSSIVFMPLFGYAKKRIGNELDSAATAGEGAQNILCAYLSVAILVGLAANALAGWWWADPLVALLVAVVAVQAGLRTWGGQSCDSGLLGRRLG